MGMVSNGFLLNYNKNLCSILWSLNLKMDAFPVFAKNLFFLLLTKTWYVFQDCLNDVNTG